MGELERLDLGILCKVLADVAGGDHGVEHDELPLLRHEEILIGGVDRGRVGDAGEHGGFWQGDVLRCLAEIAVGGGGDPVVAAAVVDRVEVELEDLVLGVVCFHVEGEQQLLRLAAERLFVAEEEVLHELLRDGARAFLDAAVLEVDERRAQNAFGIDAMMLVEPPILDGDDGMEQVWRHLLDGDVAVFLDVGIHGAAQEDEAFEPVASCDGFPVSVRAACRRHVSWFRQEITDALPGARQKDVQAAGERKSEEEDDQEKDEETKRSQAAPTVFFHAQSSFGRIPSIIA